MKLLAVLEATTGHFSRNLLPSPRLQAELLLAHALNLPRLGLYLQFERDLTPAELETLRSLVRRRAAREPLQHLTGSTAFSGLTLLCRPTALIPRPETEILVEHAARLLQEIPPGWVIDVGTGTGAIPLALARRQPQHRYLGLDISAEAIVLAAERYDGPEPVNVGAGFEIKIKELVPLIAQITGFKGKIVWDATKPDGQPRRMLDVTRAEKFFGFKAKVGFEAGLRDTIAWYEKNR